MKRRCALTAPLFLLLLTLLAAGCFKLPPKGFFEQQSPDQQGPGPDATLDAELPFDADLPDAPLPPDGELPDGDLDQEDQTDQFVQLQCTPGATQCDGKRLRTCAESGDEWIETPCSCGCDENGDDARCVPSCTAGERECDGDAVVTCNLDGCGFAVLRQCSRGCDPENAKCRLCQPGARSCTDEGNVEVCSLDGLLSKVTEICKGGCKDGECNACVPGTKRCSPAGSIEVCATNGTYQSVFTCEAGCDPLTVACLACKPGERRCDGGNVAVCTATGNLQTVACPQGCNEKTAACYQCKPGSQRCNGQALERCLDDGSGWTVVTPCDGQCDSGQCLGCKNGDQRCESGKLLVCSAGDWIGTDCPFGCSAQTNKCHACAPNSKQCNQNLVQQCASDGSGWKTIETCGGKCVGGQCSGACKFGDRKCDGASLLVCSQNNEWVSTSCSGGCNPTTKECNACIPHESRCLGGDVEVCDASGSGWKVLKACAFGCKIGTKDCLVCKGGSKECDANGNLRTCETDGSGWSSVSCPFGCDPTSLSCKQACTPNSKRCGSSGHIEACDSAGSQWEIVEKCVLGCDPQSVSCKQSVTCKAGETRCSADGKIETCRPDGSGWSVTKACQYGCDAGQCLSPDAFDGVAAGYYHSCAIRTADHSLWCWGRNVYGSLGTGDKVDRPKPALVIGGSQWLSVSAGGYGTCGIKSDGSLWCWGIGSLFGKSSSQGPTQPQSMGAGKWKQVDVGNTHACALGHDDSLWCWGQNNYGQLGNGLVGGSTGSPVRVGQDPSVKWNYVAAGLYGTCALRNLDDAETGQLYCWGSNQNGSLGMGAVTLTLPTPTQVQPVDARWRRVDLLYRHACGIQADNTLWCWGYNNYGQGGVVSPTTLLTPTKVGNEHWIDVTTGYDFTCAVKASGSAAFGEAWCFGRNSYGQLGNPEIPDKSMGKLAGDQLYREISAGYFHACGLTSNDEVTCWGNSQYGQTANGYQAEVLQPNEPAPFAPWSAVYAGVYTVYGVTQSNAVYGWGYNQYGNLGVGTKSTSSPPVALPSAFTVIDGHQYHACGIKGDGSLWCWGNNAYGRLGLSTSISEALIPQLVKSGNPLAWKVVTTGYYHSCGLRTDGSLWCWGRDSQGVFGNGSTTTTTHPSPIPISSGVSWSALQTNRYHSCGIQSDGSLWCWGLNSYGQLGDGTKSTRPDPTPILPGTKWLQVSLGDYHTCGIQQDKRVYCWGRNIYGEVGDGTQTTRLVPTAVLGNSTWKMVGAGGYHSCGILTDDAMLCWGRNAYGELGNGTKTTALSPVAVITNKPVSWKTMTARLFYNTCGVTTAGELYCWGYNSFGQASVGAALYQTTPNPVILGN